MSISHALNSAGQGLAASARAIQVVSGNVANAMTPGYSARSLQLAAISLGGQGAGVRVLGVARQADPILQGLLRTAGAGAAQSETRTGFWQAVETAFGLPDSPGSLSGALDALSSALIAAAERPDLDSRLAGVTRTAGGLIDKIGRIQDAVQDQRRLADTAIARDVATLNEGMNRLHGLNTEIVSLEARGQSSLELQDERDALLQSLSEIVPLKAHLRPEGRMMVFTEGGTVLLDLQPVAVGFTAAAEIAPGSSLAGGQLSGLTVNGVSVATGPNGPMAGGRLGAAFALRDGDGPAVQTALDSLAESLVARFQDPATDPSATPGLPGLFTDNGAAMAGAPAPGLAGRLALNPLVDPAVGGALWRLRDGLGAAAPGPVGDSAQIARWIAAIDRPVAPAPGVAARGLEQELADTLSGLGQARYQAEERRIYAVTVHDALRQQQLEGGVDIDAEMRRLIQIETAYAANARVIQVADDMLRRLMEI